MAFLSRLKREIDTWRAKQHCNKNRRRATKELRRVSIVFHKFTLEYNPRIKAGNGLILKGGLSLQVTV